MQQAPRSTRKYTGSFRRLFMLQMGLPTDFPKEVEFVIEFKAEGNQTELTITEYGWTMAKCRNTLFTLFGNPAVAHDRLFVKKWGFIPIIHDYNSTFGIIILQALPKRRMR
jgi:hypothetical protein